MLRKLALTIAAMIALAGAGLYSTAASAAMHGGFHGGGFHGGGFHGGGFHGGGFHGGGFHNGFRGGFHGGFRHRAFFRGAAFGIGFYPAYDYGYYGYGYDDDCYLQRRYVRTPWGLRVRNVRVCY